jgi:hypothetical protein
VVRRSGRTVVTLGLAGVTSCAALLTAVPAQAMSSVAVTTTTSLVAAPDPATPGATVTLTATVTAADNSSPAGTVQFQVGTSNIGAAVTVSGGQAAATTTFAAAGSLALTAVFTPTSAAAYSGSTGTFAEMIQGAAAPAAGSGSAAGTVPVAFSVPQSGTFTVSVAPGTVPLTITGLTATGTLPDVTVTDTRNYYPGWSVSGQESDFVGAGAATGSTISGNQLGWTPTAVGTLADGATLGPAVTPVNLGIGSTAATLAFAGAGCGFGTNVLSASLTLDIPAAAVAGPYAGTLTVTYVVSQPSQSAGCVPVTVTF